MQDPANYDPDNRKDNPLRTSRPELRKHYFHFGACYGKQATAILKVAGCSLDVVVPEQTQYGFTVIGSAKTAEGLRLGARWVLNCGEKRFEVFPQWIHCAADGRVQIGLRCMRQLPAEPKRTVWSRFRCLLRSCSYRAFPAAIVMTILLSALWVKRTIDSSQMHGKQLCQPVEVVWKSDE